MFSRSSPDTQTQTLPEILLEAMMRENIEIEEVIDILASIKNLDIDQLFADGRTPLVLACERGNLPLVKLLVERYGAKVGAKVDYGAKFDKELGFHVCIITPLISAISDCPDALQIVWYLLDKEADPNKHFEYKSPLSLAAEVGDEKIVEALLVRGAHVKRNNCQPCVAAAGNNHAAIISLLAEWGADMHEPVLHVSPLAAATDGDHTETINILLELGVRIDPHTLLFCCKNVERGLELFNRFLPVFSPENSIEVMLNIDFLVSPSLLTEACVKNNIPLINRLLGLGANPITDVTDASESPVSFTPEVKDILSAAKVKWKAEQPLLLEAIKQGDTEKVRSLLEQGVPANQLTHDKSSSPLHLAAEIGNVDIIKILCRSGAKNRTNRKKVTPLDMAIANGRLPAVICLLGLGAPITKNSIETAMKIRTTNPEIETLLLKYLKEGKNIPINPSDRYVMEKDPMEKDPVCSLRFFAANFVHRELEKAFREDAKQRVLSYLRP
jgi:ankyrin repeat protein